MKPKNSTVTAERPRLGSYVEKGEFTPLEEIEGQEVLIHSIDPITTKFGEAFRVGITDEAGAVQVCCLGQMLIYPALVKLLGDLESGEVTLPVAARFVKSGRTWTVE